MNIHTLRDLLVADTVPGIVIACDCVGGIGPREADTFTCEAELSAYFAARVPLLELVCAGAKPVALIDTLCQDKESSKPIIREFLQIADEVGIPREAVSGSTEDNVATKSTGIGVVVIGELDGPILSGGGRPGDVVICVGWPRSAPVDRLYREHPDLVPISDMQHLVASGLLHDALPVGSKGLQWELSQMAETAHLGYSWIDEQPVPVSSSGGPSACVLIACAPDDEATLRSLVRATVPWTPVGRLEER